MLLPAKFTIPNALLILFFPLYTFCNQFDIFTVCTADNRILSDLYVVRDKGACYDCTFFYFHTRISTLSIIFAPGATFAPVNRTEFLTRPSTIHPCVINALSILACAPIYCGSASVSWYRSSRNCRQDPVHCSYPADPYWLPIRNRWFPHLSSIL